MKLSDITCCLGASKIHGIGVFTLKDVKKGDKLHINLVTNDWYSPIELGSVSPEIKNYLIERWPTILDGSDFVYPFDILPCYLNHSDKPNYDPMTDLALEDIKKGKEVFEDYGKYKDRLLKK